MFTFGFYDSLNGDRKYNAEQMSAIFDGIIEDGVYSNVGEAFMVVPGTGLQVIVKTGRAWFKHTWNLNDSWLPLAIEEADVLRPRIDAVVIEVDSRLESRTNSIKIVKGTPTTTPTPPAMTHENGVDQYRLADITVPSGATSIEEANVANKVGQGDTPFVICPLESVDISDLFQQWNGEFNDWFDNLKAQLSDNIVTNLQDQIDNRVKIEDKATAEDILNGTPGKWVPSELISDSAATAKIGEIVYSTKDLEKDSNGIFLKCDQRPVTLDDYPDLCATEDMKWRYDFLNADRYTEVTYGGIAYPARLNSVVSGDQFIYGDKLYFCTPRYYNAGGDKPNSYNSLGWTIDIETGMASTFSATWTRNGTPESSSTFAAVSRGYMYDGKIYRINSNSRIFILDVETNTGEVYIESGISDATVIDSAAIAKFSPTVFAICGIPITNHAGNGDIKIILTTDFTSFSYPVFTNPSNSNPVVISEPVNRPSLSAQNPLRPLNSFNIMKDDNGILYAYTNLTANSPTRYGYCIYRSLDSGYIWNPFYTVLEEPVSNGWSSHKPSKIEVCCAYYSNGVIHIFERETYTIKNAAETNVTAIVPKFVGINAIDGSKIYEKDAYEIVPEKPYAELYIEKITWNPRGYNFYYSDYTRPYKTSSSDKILWLFDTGTLELSIVSLPEWVYGYSYYMPPYLSQFFYINDDVQVSLENNEQLANALSRFNPYYSNVYDHEKGAILSRAAFGLVNGNYTLLPRFNVGLLDSDSTNLASIVLTSAKNNEHYIYAHEMKTYSDKSGSTTVTKYYGLLLRFDMHRRLLPYIPNAYIKALDQLPEEGDET